MYNWLKTGIHMRYKSKKTPLFCIDRSAHGPCPPEIHVPNLKEDRIDDIEKAKLRPKCPDIVCLELPEK